MDEKLIRRQLRNQLGKPGWILLLYNLILNVSVIAALVIDMILQGFPSGDALDRIVMGNAWGYLAASLIGVLLLLIWKKRPFRFCELWQTERRMTPRSFAVLLVLFISAQAAFQILALAMEALLNLFGLSVLNAIESASGVSDSVSMFLYVGLVAPIVEEILFRGLLLRMLRPYGKLFAIVMTAFLFGMFHGNPVQSPYAFLVGLILAYVALEYSVGWAMVLHMGNNLILGDTLTRISHVLPQGVGDAIFVLLIWGCFLAGIVILICMRKKLAAYASENRIHPWCSKSFFGSAGIIFFTIIMLLSMLAGITPM